jgi:hypothetical protein
MFRFGNTFFQPGKFSAERRSAIAVIFKTTAIAKVHLV